MIEPRQLEQIYTEHASALYAFLMTLTRHESDTRDILQDVFCQLAARPECLRGVANVRAWLVRTAHRKLIDASRRRAVRERYSESEPELFAEAAAPDESAFRQALARAMRDLPEDQRAVVHLKLWGGLTFAEIAMALDIPANTAASRYRYGIDKLRSLLRPIYEELA